MLRKNDFIQRFAARGYTKKDSEIIYRDFLGVIAEILVEDETLAFRGFGTFRVYNTKDRTNKSIKDGQDVVVRGRKTPKFVAGDTLKRMVELGVVDEHFE